MEEPKVWTPPTGAGQGGSQGGSQGGFLGGLPGGKGGPSLARLAFGAVIAIAAGLMIYSGVQQMRGGLGQLQALNADQFDPAKAPALGDPRPAIIAYLQKAAGGDRPDARMQGEIDQFVTNTRAETPSKLDDITTMVGVQNVGRRVAFDYRVMLNTPVGNLREFRKNLGDKMQPYLVTRMCDPSNAQLRQFMTERNITISHAYTLNDGNPTIFIDISPAVCAQAQPT